MLSGDNGLLKRAGDARDDTVVGQEKEQVELAYVSSAVKNLGANVTDENLQDELDISVGSNKTKVTKTSNDSLNVLFKETEHNYNVKDGVVTKVDDTGELSDLEKLREYFIGKGYEDFYDNINYEYKDIEPISDASESISYCGKIEEWHCEIYKYNNTFYKVIFDDSEEKVIDVETIIEDYAVYHYSDQTCLIDMHNGSATSFDEAYVIYNGTKLNVKENGTSYFHGETSILYIMGWKLYQNYNIPEGTYECIIVKDGEEYSGNLIINQENFD